jgi:Cys-rich protein (TIGR01571 family)
MEDSKAVPQDVSGLPNAANQTQADNTSSVPSAPEKSASLPGLLAPQGEVSGVAVAVRVEESNHHYIPVNDADNPKTVIRSGAWEATLFGCFSSSVPNCCMATCCPCISAAQIASRVGFDYMQALPVFVIAAIVECIVWYVALLKVFLAAMAEMAMAFNDDFNGSNETMHSHYLIWTYLASLVSIGMIILYWQLRTKVRARFDLPGSCFEDCAVSMFCYCCSLAQMATHLKTYKPGDCNFGPPDTLPAYTE